MTRDAYNALADCARRRIEQEWSCTEAERAVLSLITELSFCLGQSLALVPCLADFAAVTGLHKSTISRAIRSALKKGYLEITKRREETLYAVSIETPADKQAGSGGERDAALLRLIEINEGRLQGVADGNGQQRLPGIFESEEINAPSQAFDAILQREPPPLAAPLGPARSAPQETTLSSRPVHVTGPQIEDRLSQLSRAMESAREAGEQRPQQRPANRGASSYEAQWKEATRGLSGDALYAMEQLRDECALADAREEASFYQWRFTWRKRVIQYPRQCVEAVGVCKAMRLEGNAPKQPGAFVYRTLQAMSSFSPSD